MRDMSMGYTGQRRSGVSEHYLLGNGYRGFNPVLKRFATQDSISPFSVGGGHGFAYCDGNPVNKSDPSGHGPLVDFILAMTVARRNVRRATEDAYVAAIQDGVADISNAAIKANLDVSFSEEGSVTKIGISGTNTFVDLVGLKEIQNSATNIIPDLLADGEHGILTMERLTHGSLDDDIKILKDGVNIAENSNGARISHPFLGRLDYIRNDEGFIDGLSIKSGSSFWVTNINDTSYIHRAERYLRNIIDMRSLPPYSEYFYGGTPQGEVPSPPPDYDFTKNNVSRIRQ